MIPKLTN